MIYIKANLISNYPPRYSLLLSYISIIFIFNKNS